MSKTEQANAEFRVEFTLDSNLIDHLAFDQASTVDKAFMELIMNSVDAGASRIDITVDPTGFTIRDDGKGFASREEIEQNFARWGTPHEQGDARFGRFRIGRAQILRFAKVEWRSNSFRMNVDLKSDSRGFVFTENLPNEPGCAVTGIWYYAGTERFLGERLASLIEYVDVEVSINGQRIPTLKDKTWDKEDDIAYYKLADHYSSLAVYNQGIFVDHVPHYVVPMGGVVVTKVPLSLTMSRDSVRHDDPVWIKIRNVVTEAHDKLYQTGELTGTDKWKVRTMYGFLKGEFSVTDVPIKLLGMGKGQSDLLHLAIGLMAQTTKSVDGMATLAFAQHGDIGHGEQVAKQTGIPVIHHESLWHFTQAAERFLREEGRSLGNTDPFQITWYLVDTLYRNLFDSLDDEGETWDGREAWVDSFYDRTGDCLDPECLLLQPCEINVQDVRELRSPMESSRPLEDSELTQADRDMLNIIRKPLRNLGNTIQRWSGNQNPARKVLLGVADKKIHAWTDGSDEITFNRDYLRKTLKKGAPGVQDLVATTLHEYAHYEPSYGQGHDARFYEYFHEMMMANTRAVTRAMDAIITAQSEAVPALDRDEFKPIVVKGSAWNSYDPVAIKVGMSYVKGFGKELKGVVDGRFALNEVIQRNKQLLKQLNQEKRAAASGDRGHMGLSLIGRQLLSFILSAKNPDRIPDPRKLIKLQTAVKKLFPNANVYRNSYDKGFAVIRLTQVAPSHFNLVEIYVRENTTSELYWGTDGSSVPKAVRDKLESLLDSHRAAMPWKQRDIALELAWTMAWLDTANDIERWSNHYALIAEDGDPLDHVRFEYNGYGSKNQEEGLGTKDIEARLVKYIQSVKEQSGGDVGKFWTKLMLG